MENEQERIRNMPANASEADVFHVSRAMQRGGGFLTALGDALRRADSENARLIFASWGDNIQREWDAYRRYGGW